MGPLGLAKARRNTWSAGRPQRNVQDRRRLLWYSRATRLLGPVTVQVDVLTIYGRPNEQREVACGLRLKEAQETCGSARSSFLGQGSNGGTR